MSTYGRKVRWKVKWYEKYGRKPNWIVKRYGKYGRKPSWIVKRFGKYRRKLWKDINTACNLFKFTLCPTIRGE